jgi:hypothetical protein
VLASAPTNWQGSDTLFDMTTDVISQCDVKFSDPATVGDVEEPGQPAFANGINYLGGGTGVGAAAMQSGAQHAAPGSRPLKNSEMCTGGAGSSPAQTEAMSVALDGIAVAANANSTCGGNAAGTGPNANLNGRANALATTGKTFTYGAAATTYTIRDSFDVLRLIYFGLDNSGAAAGNTSFDCNGVKRKGLIANWANLFETTCAVGNGLCPGGLRHALRRSDLSGTTDAFVSLVGAGSRGIGNNPFVANPPGPTLGPKTNPFCNSYDANTTDTLVEGGPVVGPAYPVCGAGINCAQNFACDQPTSSPPAGHCIWTNAVSPPRACAANADCPHVVYTINSVTGGFSGCNTTTGLCTTSDAGMSDFQADWDPIRIRCLTPTAPPAAQAQQGTGFEEVCSVDSDNVTTLGGGSLGLVLTVLLPDVAGVLPAQDYPTVDCGNNTCDLVPPTTPASRIPPGFLCPDGFPPVLNRCWAPFAADATLPSGHQFNCRADKRTDHCFGLPNGLANGEGRTYNKAQMKTDGTGQNVIDANGRIMSSSFYRLRAGLNSRTPFPTGGTNVDPSPCASENDDTSQIGCLTTADPCILGYAGRESAPPGSNKALWVQGFNLITNTSQAAALEPSNANIINLINGSVYNNVYPIARRLFLATIYGFDSASLNTSEAQMAKCYGDSYIAAVAATDKHFVPLPSGNRCYDYAEDASVASGVFIDPSATDITDTSGRIGNGGCVAQGFNTNTNACATHPAPLGPTTTEVGNIVQNIDTLAHDLRAGVSANPLAAGCGTSGCHDGTNPTGPPPQRYDFTSGAAFKAATVGVLSQECPTKFLIATPTNGGSAASYVVDKLNGSATTGCFSGVQMPAGHTPATAQWIATIAKWIDDGTLPN